MALKFYASVRMDVRRIQSIKAGQDIIGNRTRVRVVKNKVAPPFRTVEFDIMYNEGISKAGDLLDLAVELEIIEKRGSFYSYGDTRLGQGRENAKQYLREDEGMAQAIENQIRDELLGEVVAVEEVIEEVEEIEEDVEEIIVEEEEDDEEMELVLEEE
jgi:recombination protein RecA